MTDALMMNPLPNERLPRDRLMARLAAGIAPQQVGTFVFDALFGYALSGCAGGYESPKSGSGR